MITITLNGEPRAIRDQATIADLMAESGLPPGAAAVAVNLEFVPRSMYEQTKLHAGDEVEVVTPRQGG